LPDDALLDMGDFAGAVLKYLRRHPVPRLTIAGGIGKLTKLAAGHLDLHSGRSQVDPAVLAVLVAASGVPDAETVAETVSTAGTALDALEICGRHGVPLADLVADAARRVAAGVVRGAPIEVDVVVVDRAGLVIGSSPVSA
jgi:cobalt-precorrin-5B (C1)-methyltransferase